MLFNIHAYEMLESKKVLGSKQTVNDFLTLKELLEKSSHEFLCILTPDQTPIEYLFKKYGLFDYLEWSTETATNKYIRNQNYPDSGRRLYMFVLKGKGDSNAT